MRRVLILDCPEIGCPTVLKIVFSELCGTFRRRGIDVKVINTIKEIEDNSIVFMGDIFRVDNPAEHLAIQSVKAIYIGWYWHKQSVKGLPFFLHVYENALSLNPKDDKKDMLHFMKQRKNTCPLLLRANEDPDVIGSYERTSKYDYCFMGGKMCTHVIPFNEFKGLCDAQSYAKYYMPYDKRKQVYLSSLFALGLQTLDNRLNGHVSQRIFEGMAYGCVVLTNSLAAYEQTDYIVDYFCSKKDLIKKMKYYINNPDKMEWRRQKGYEFIRRQGTNEYSMELIRNTIKDVYDMDIFT